MAAESSRLCDGKRVVGSQTTAEDPGGRRLSSQSGRYFCSYRLTTSCSRVEHSEIVRKATARRSLLLLEFSYKSAK